MNIAVIGAGNVGGNLGTHLSKVGYPVRFGLKEGVESAALLARAAKDASAGSVEDAAEFGDVVFFALPAAATTDVARSVAPQLTGKIVVECGNPLSWQDGPVWAPPAEGSLAAAVAKAAPGARVVKAFNTFGAEHHADSNLTGAPAVVFMAGDDADAKTTLGDIATKAGYRPIDAGPLRNAGVLENVAMLWIHLALVGGRGRGFVFDVSGA
jgi:8-hydroxy-5-deazaflavin:NADPH oxidoreductase